MISFFIIIFLLSKSLQLRIIKSLIHYRYLPDFENIYVKRKIKIMLKKKTLKKFANVGRGNAQKVGGKIHQNKNNTAESRHQQTRTES